MNLKFIQKKVNYLLFLILLVSVLIVSGCALQNAGKNVTQGLQIVIKDVGFPEVKYLQPTIKEVQLQDESGKWTVIWSSPEGKTMKLTPDGAEVLLDTVSVPAGIYIGTKLMVSTVDVEVDVNKDGDTLDKNVQIVLTLEEFESLPPKEKPSAPSGGGSPPTKPEQPSPPSPPPAPSAPQKSQAPEIKLEAATTDKPQKPAKPSPPPQPPEPSQPSAPSASGGGQKPSPPYTIVDGLVYMPEFIDEVHTVTLNDYIVPIMENNFVYSGSGGKLIYDFSLHQLLQKRDQISVDVSMTNASIIVNPVENTTTTVLLDDFNDVTKGKGFGALTYEDSLPNMDKAINLAKGNYIKYSFSPWYKWDGARSWNRNEAAPGVLTEGKVEMWIKPRQYTGISIGERGKPSGILTFNWADVESAPQEGYIMHLGFTADGKLTYSNWGGNLDYPLVGKTTIPLNTWTHVAVSWGTKGTNLYVDGKVDASTTGNMWPAFSGPVFVYLNYWGANDLGLVDDLHISNVDEPPAIILPINITESITANVTANITTNVTENITTNVIVNTTMNTTVNVTANTTANVTADVKISDFTCGWTSEKDQYGSVRDFFRVIAKGTAQGQVGARLELPILIWSDDKFNCGNWTLSKGALIAVGSTCVRKAGQPEITSWIADTGGEETIEKGYWKNRSYSVKIYKGNEIYSQAENNKTAPCQ